MENKGQLHESGEDYLEAILILEKRQGDVLSVDVAHYMGYSKPSVCNAVRILKKGGYLYMDSGKYLHLTDSGREVAEKIYERHRFFTDFLIQLGVNPKRAELDACRMEHAISEESFEKLKGAVRQNDKA